MQQITVEMIETKEFQIKPRGYDQQEVDGFLDDICDELDRLNAEMADLRQQLADAKAAAARPRMTSEAPTQTVPVVKAGASSADTADAFKEILEMAQKVKEETIAEAERKAAEITEKAQAAADEQLHDLTGTRNNLQQEIAVLKQTARDYRAQFEALLKTQQEALSKTKGLF